MEKWCYLVLPSYQNFGLGSTDKSTEINQPVSITFRFYTFSFALSSEISLLLLSFLSVILL